MTTDFGRVASLYARVRPGYLPTVFEDLVALWGMLAGGRILEIGPGTGQATRPLLERGYLVTGIEPDAAMAEEARRHRAGAGGPRAGIAGMSLAGRGRGVREGGGIAQAGRGAGHSEHAPCRGRHTGVLRGRPGLLRGSYARHASRLSSTASRGGRAGHE